MASDPAAALEAGVYAALTAAPAMIAAFGGAPRIFDDVPVDPATGTVATALFPYCTIGDDQLVGQTNQNTDVTEAFVKVETWSRGPSFAEAKAIAAAVRAALDAAIPLAGHDVVTHVFHGAQMRREPDGLTRRVITTIRFQTVPSAPTPYS